MKSKNKLRKTSGITLVALVITIIILVLLAGISISAITNQGLFEQTLTAKNLTEQKTAGENETLQNYLEQINLITEGIVENKQLVNEIKITPETSTLEVGDTLELLVTILPEVAYNKNIQWTSSNEEVATVEQNGKVTTLAEGTTIITAYAQDGSNVYGNCEILVKSKDLVIFDYKDGGVKYEMEYASTGYSVGPSISNECIYGNCTVSSVGWRGLQTKSTFDLTKYKYLYFEGVFQGKYTDSHGVPFAELYCIITLNSEGVYEYYSHPVLPITSNYQGFYIDISGNEWKNTRVYLSPKMEGDSIRVFKYTNVKPEGTYLGAFN